MHCGKRLPASRQATKPPLAAKPGPPPPRPAPPRPGPRAVTTAPPPPSRVPEAFAATVPPNTLPALKDNPPPQPHNGPSPPKASPVDATLKPLAEVKPSSLLPKRPIGDSEMVTVTRPPTAAPTGTLLGLPAQEMPSALVPASPASRDSGRRTTQPQSLKLPGGTPARALPSFADDDGATEVHAGNNAPEPLDDLPTGPTERADALDDEADTNARPSPPRRPQDSLATPAKGVPVPRPRNNTPPPLPPPSNSGKSGPRATVPMPAAREPAPLPPPPSVPPLVPSSPSSLIQTLERPLPPVHQPGERRVSNDAGSFPQLDPVATLAPTPAIPTLALPPMPEHPRSASIIDAVKYLLPLAKAIWARKKAQDTIRALLHGDQRLLDSVLRDLGRVAREEELPVPALADEMRRVQEQEARRANAEREATDAETAAQREEDRWRIDLGERNADLGRRESELKAVDEELRLKAEERRLHEAERTRIEGEIRVADKRIGAAEAKAVKAEALPPEKGGGANTAANIRSEAAVVKQEAAKLAPARDNARAAAEALDGPIALLTEKLTDARATLTQKKKETIEATSTHEQTLQDLQVKRERAIAERDAAERELTQRFVTAGTILNLNRVEHPKLAPLFARVDELKDAVNAREAAIVRLEAERRVYDRGAVQKGLMTVGIAAGALIILAIILIIVFAR
ncbi:MAG TPA: hypothetical protein VIA18_23510 [Polyangia bacterium]|nr:hypothetical protein [Polyangia bacterium]